MKAYKGPVTCPRAPSRSASGAPGFCPLHPRTYLHPGAWVPPPPWGLTRQGTGLKLSLSPAPSRPQPDTAGEDGVGLPLSKQEVVGEV